MNKLINKKVYICMSDYENKRLSYMYYPMYESLIQIFKNLNNEVYFQINNINYLKITESYNIFIYVGIYEVEKVQFKYLKDNGIYTIYYQSEPDIILFNEINEICEIYDYSKYNILNNNINTIKKYIPLICDINLYKMKQKDSENLKLIFLGGSPPEFPDSRPNKFKFLMSSVYLKENLISLYNIWNEKDFEKLLLNDYSSIFLNINREG